MSLTPNYGWPTPDDSDLVKDGAAAIRLLGDAIDETLPTVTVPVGGIILWSGLINQLPDGWQLCDGSNGTPNLSGRFVVGAGGQYAVGANGGAETVALTTEQMPAHNHAASTNTAGGHGHTASTNTTGSHGHTASTGTAGEHVHKTRGQVGSSTTDHTEQARFAGGAPATSGAFTLDTLVGTGDHSHSVSVGTNGNHSHTVTVNNADGHSHTVTVGNRGNGEAHENRPPYYALAYIMRVA